MVGGTLKRELARLRAAIGVAPTGADRLAPLRADPAAILTGMIPDRWQSAVLRARADRLLMTCSRQSGKSTVAAALGLREALFMAGSLVLLLSPTLRQSGELFRKLLALFNALGRPMGVSRETALTLELGNGSRVVSLPESESGIRGYSAVRLLIVDEAARVQDDTIQAVRPMLAVSGGGLVALTSPFGKRGWYYEAWQSGEGWERVRVTADRCPRISPEFLAEERLAIGERWFQQEYMCSFEDAVGAVFMEADIAAAMQDVPPLFPGAGP